MKSAGNNYSEEDKEAVLQRQETEIGVQNKKNLHRMCNQLDLPPDHL